MTYTFTSRTLVALICCAVVAGAMLAWVANASQRAVEGRTPVIRTEDALDWSCVREGNVTCSVDGVLVTSLADMPPVSQPFERCVYLLMISERVDAFEYSTTLCDPILTSGG